MARSREARALGPDWPAKHPWDKLPRGGTHPYLPPRPDWLKNPPRGEEGGYLDARRTSGRPISPPTPPSSTGTSSTPTALIPTSDRTEKSTTARIISREGSGMSAITETEPGREMVCILEYSAPRNAAGDPSPGDRRVFRVGERVRLVSSFDKRTPEDNPTGAMAVFEPLGGGETLYSATGSYFVTVDCWEGLRSYFAKSLVVTIGRGPAPAAPMSRPTSSSRSRGPRRRKAR